MNDQLVAETSISQHTTLTTDKHPCPPVGFEPTISAGERPKTYALDRAATGTCSKMCVVALNTVSTIKILFKCIKCKLITGIVHLFIILSLVADTAVCDAAVVCILKKGKAGP